jgi:hypothetical protein
LPHSFLKKPPDLDFIRKYYPNAVLAKEKSKALGSDMDLPDVILVKESTSNTHSGQINRRAVT